MLAKTERLRAGPPSTRLEINTSLRRVSGDLLEMDTTSILRQIWLRVIKKKKLS